MRKPLKGLRGHDLRHSWVTQPCRDRNAKCELLYRPADGSLPAEQKKVVTAK